MTVIKALTNVKGYSAGIIPSHVSKTKQQINIQNLKRK